MVLWGKGVPCRVSSKWKDPEVRMSQCVPGNPGSVWLEQNPKGSDKSNRSSYGLEGILEEILEQDLNRGVIWSDFWHSVENHINNNNS